jgi:Holliday junction resolvase RusA-like endonuclease
MLDRVEFIVPGPPQTKARARVVRLPNGKSHAYTPEKTVLYENWIKTCYVKAYGNTRAFPDDAKLALWVTAFYEIPKSASAKKRAAMLADEIGPKTKSDFDNALKAIADGLNGIAYRDDAQITFGAIERLYGEIPRVEVLIERKISRIGRREDWTTCLN